MVPLQTILRLCSRPALPGCKYYLRNNNVFSRISASSFCTTNDNVTKIGDVVKHWSNQFEHEGIPEPVESIEHIVAHVLGTKKIMDLMNLQEEELTKDQLEKLWRLCECRLSRMPVQYIIGEWDFRDITLRLVPPVFIPRPETEILVDYVLKRVSSTKSDICRILEIGCGSGAISLALVHACSKIRSIAVDKSLYACKLTNQNGANLGLQDRVTVVNAVLQENGTIRVLDQSGSIDFNEEQFDLIVSNPPYVPTPKLFDLAPEIKIYEDLRALDGGKDGLSVIKPILKYSATALRPGGHLFVEVDPVHPEYIKFFTKKYADLKLKYEHTYKDFCSNDRFVEVSKLS